MLARRAVILAFALCAAIACGQQDSSASLHSSSSGPSPASSPAAAPQPSLSPAVVAPRPSSPARKPASAASTNCFLSSPMAHVYNAYRLKVLAPCVTVAGTLMDIRNEADGDYHVLVRLDPGSLCAGQDCLDGANRSMQGGDLVVETVCQHSISQSDAVSACSGYTNTIVIPSIGSHTTVTGPWVYDSDHGWNEIHPVERFGSSTMSTQTAHPPPPAGSFTVRITASRYGYVAAATQPGAACTAQAKLPSGRISTASGLQGSRTAGSDGSVSWTYYTSSSTTPGTGTHTVSCTWNGHSASASASFTVT